MKVFNIMLARARGGVESMAVRYHEAMAAEGHAVTSFGHPAGVLPEELPASAFRPLVARFDYDPLSVLRLADQIRRSKPDLILTHGGRAAGLCRLAGAGGRTVAVMHNQFFKTYTRGMRAGFCVSRSVLEAARAAYPALPLYEVTNFTHLAARAVKAAPAGPPVIGALGRLHEQKAFHLLLEALAALKAKGSPFSARIAGEGPERGALERLRGSLGLEAEVSFTGWVSPPVDFLADLDLYVMTSHYEPFGLSLAEALAAGVPAVATDIEGPREILAGGRFGRLFPNRDVDALTDALAAAMADWPATLGIAETAKAHAVETYGFDAGRARLARALEAVAGRPGQAKAK